MRSLRARLMAVLLALSRDRAAGPRARSPTPSSAGFLYDRVDQQVRSSPRRSRAPWAARTSHAARRRCPARRCPRPSTDPRPGGDELGAQPPRAPTASGATPTARSRTRSRSATAREVVAQARPARHGPGRQPVHRRAVEWRTVRATASRRPRPVGRERGRRARCPLAEEDQHAHQLLLVMGLVIARRARDLGVVAWIVVRIGLLPLDRMGHTAGAIAGGDLSHASRRPTRGPRSAASGIALNAMLDRLEHAFAEREASEDRLRRFLADASHELRTPLASIRGYAELFRMRRGARAGGHASARCGGSRMRRQRMGVLVEDLLTLARLDEVAEAPQRELDLAALAGDAVDDARATAPDREIDLRVEGPALVLGDAHQLRQVLRQPAAQRARAHAAGHADRGQRRPTIGETVRARGARPRSGAARGRGRRSCSSASGAPRAAASAAGPAPAWGWRSWRRSSAPTAAAWGPPTRPAAARAFTVELLTAGVACGRGPVATPLTDSTAADPDVHRPTSPLLLHASPGAMRPSAGPGASPDRHRGAGLQRGGASSTARCGACTASSSAGFPFTWRIVIADNASIDATPEIAAALASSLRRRRGAAPGAQGPRAARCAPPGRPATPHVVCYMDVDLSTDLRALLPLVAPLLSGHSDLAIGSRLAAGARVVRGPKRELISRSYNRILHLVAARPLQRRPVRLQGGAPRRRRLARRRRP